MPAQDNLFFMGMSATGVGATQAEEDFVLQDEIFIEAPVELVFALSTNIEVVQQTLGFHPTPSTGNITAGSRVHWKGWLFGLPQVHHTLITGFEAPIYFQDTQESGRFLRFYHNHHMTPTGGGTNLHDDVHFTLPFGYLGRLVAKYIIAPHTQRLLRTRFELLKRLAEGPEEGWQKYT